MRVRNFLIRKNNEHITLMVVPHTQRKMLNIQFSVLTVAIVIIIVGLAGLIFSTTFLVQLLAENESSRKERKVEELAKTKETIRQMKSLVDKLKPELITATKHLSKDEQVSFPGIGGSAHDTVMFKPYSKEYYMLKDFDINLNYQYKVVKSLNRYLEKRKEILTATPSMWPVYKKSGYITSKFGKRFDPISGRIGMHRGIDIACFPGEKIVATAPGMVVFAGWHSAYGRKIVIRHKYGFKTAYAHNRKLMVPVGRQVKAGQVIALAGSSGKSTGVHLHYEVHIGDKTIDPEPFLLLSNY